jgi:hypothetical protein
MASTANTSSTITLIPFSGTNYQLWKMKALAYLKSQKWYDAMFPVTATTSTLSTLTLDASKPSAASKGIKAPVSSEEQVKEKEIKETKEPKETKETYETYKAKAYAFLTLSLSDEVLSLFTSVKQDDPAELWNAIQKHYESDTVTSKHMLRQLMTNQKLKGSEDISKYVSRIVQYSQQLKGMGDMVSESDMLFALFNGLPQDYEGLASSLNIQKNLKFAEAVQHLKDKYELLKLKRDKDENSLVSYAHAHAASDNNNKYKKHNNNNSNSNNKKPGNNSNRKPKACTTCNKHGHSSFYCPQNKDKKKCTYCHFIGHTKDDCDYLRNSDDVEEAAAVEYAKSHSYASYSCDHETSKPNNTNNDDDYPEYCA